MSPLQSPALIDSHCHLHHLDLTEFNQDVGQVIAEASANNVQHILAVSVEPADIPKLYDLANRFPHISISVGMHPDVQTTEELDASALIALANHPSCIAIGETGLDYYRTETAEAQQTQQQRFREHIRAALACTKPLIIHTRQASEDTLRLMREEHADHIGGVMHCFTETWEVARQALDLNFYISFSGILTFKNATMIQEVAKKVPLDRILIETDAPYLAPVPFRGKQNQPAWVKHVALMLSTLRQEDYQTIAEQTTENFYRCFRCPHRAITL